MKKHILFFFSFFLCSCFSFSQTPDLLTGIWQGDDRYIFFGKSNEIAIILKEYYGWYYDRVTEPASFDSISKRTRNLATQKTAIELKTQFNKISESDDIWELTIKQDEKTQDKYPIAILNNELYLSFLVKVPYIENIQVHSEEPINGYWQGFNFASSIRFSGRNYDNDIICWYITESGIYRLRFWPTTMKYEDSKATFSDQNKLFTVNKHIFSAGTNHTCTSGRSSNIRNIEKYNDIPFTYKLNQDNTLMVIGKPYLKKLTDKESAEDLLKIVEDANKRRKPDPPALFPEEDLDWHWDLINELEKGNEIIQEVRKRQRDFGKRAQDTEKKK